jgi:hypothetical protein
MLRPLIRRLSEAASNEVERARVAILVQIDDWARMGSKLETTVPALRILKAADDAAYPELGCLVLENALVDGLYDFDPPRAPTMDIRSEGLTPLLVELREMVLGATSSDGVLRARIRCAVADANLPLAADKSAVDAAYAPITNDAEVGAFVRASGLVKSRRAYAHAQHGDPEAAQRWWSGCIRDSSEHHYYGDARAAMRSIAELSSDYGVLPASISDLASALPNRDQILESGWKPELDATMETLRGNFRSAFTEARRWIWETRLGGSLQLEREALALLGDILDGAGAHDRALAAYISAGAHEKSEAIAQRVDVVDISCWLGAQAIDDAQR